MRTSSLLVVGSLGLAVVAAPRSARAQDAEQKAMAESLFQEGRDLLNKGDTAEACKRLEQSQRLESKLGTLLNLAVCHEKLGKSASAWAEFKEAASLASKRNEPDRVKYANDRVAALEGKLSRVIVSVASPPAGLTLAIDGRAIDVAMVGLAFPVDPGKRRVTASAPGFAPWATDVEIPAGPAKTAVEVPALVPADVAPEPPVASPAAPANTPPVVVGPVATKPAPARDESWVSSVPVAAWGAFTLAGAGVIIGSITGITSIAKTGDLKCGSPSTRPCAGRVEHEANKEAVQSAKMFATVSNIAFIAGGAFAAAGVVMVLVNKPKKDPGEPKVSLAIRPAGVSTLDVRF